MKRLSRNLPRFCLICAMTFFLAGMQVGVVLADWRDESGLTELRALLGDDTPDGTGVAVSQVEAPTGVCCNNYYPNLSINPFQSNAEYTQPTLINNSASEHPSPGISNHSTNVVGVNLYGKNGMAPGANTIIMYEANDYLNDHIKAHNTTTPAAPEYVDPNDSLTKLFKVQNHSWAADTDGANPYPELNALRALAKVDYLVDEYELTTIVGVENQLGIDPNTKLISSPRPDHDTLLAYGFNSIAVGVSTGWHAIGSTQNIGGSNYGTGRRKPSLVAPRVSMVGSASSSTAITSGAAALLHQQVAGTDADRSEVARAIMMAGATKQELMDYWDQDASSDPNDTVDWNRTTTEPLDDIFGAGELNVLNNYFIAAGGQYAGSGSSGSPTPAQSHGWDYVSDSDPNSRYYQFEIPDGSLALDFSIMLTWNAEITSFSPNFTVADMDLTLFDPNGVIIESSDSPVDNHEHIYIGDRQAVEYLGPGTYTLEVGRDSARDFGLAWRTTTAYGTDPNNLIVTADFDQSGEVDAGDFLAWQRNQGTLVNASLADGDADGDGDVDQDDLNIFNAQYGVAATPNVIGVPEPGTLLLGTLAALGFALPGRRNRRSEG